MKHCNTIKEFEKEYGCTVTVEKSERNRHTLSVLKGKKIIVVQCPFPEDEAYVTSFLYKHIVYIKNRIYKQIYAVPTFTEGSQVTLFFRERTVRYYGGQSVYTSGKELFLPKKGTKKALIEYLNNRLLDIMREKTNKVCDFYGVRCQKVGIMANKTRWGYCLNNGELICYNIVLAFCPEEIADYLATHEVSHILHSGHQADFWETVARRCPRYKEVREHKKQFDLKGLLEALAV